MQELSVIKIGGKVIDQQDKLHAFLQDFAAIPGYKILVHGGGNIATDMGNKMGIQSNYVNGRRVTDEQTLELITMVYGGLINKRIVAGLQALGCNAMGFTGADGNIIPAMRRPVKEVDYGFVGDVHSRQINTGLLHLLLQQEITPVLAPLTHDAAGNLLNTNADTIAQEMAKAFAGICKVQLIYCFEKAGVLLDAGDDASVIATLREEDFERLKAEEVISGGMLPKLENAFAAIAQGVDKVIIGQAEQLPLLINGTGGTQIL